MKTLRNALQDYLAMRRALGFKLAEGGIALADFVSFLECKKAPHITTRLALAWAQRPAHVQPARWAQRLTWVRGFARYRRATDPKTEIPPFHLLPFRPKRARPYLYTDQEVRQLLKACLRLSPTDALRKWTYQALFGLLAVSGLRLGEVLSLRMSDVDLQNAVLTVRGTKFGKSRLVPLHSSTRKALSAYKSRRNQYLKNRAASDFFFVSKRGNRLDGGQVRRTFYDLSRQMGLRGESASHGPRLHDFRHRFAVRVLVKWYRAGKDVERCLPILSTYLGHVHVADTYWYLTACPELMGLVVRRLEKRQGARK